MVHQNFFVVLMNARVKKREACSRQSESYSSYNYFISTLELFSCTENFRMFLNLSLVSAP